VCQQILLDVNSLPQNPPLHGDQVNFYKRIKPIYRLELANVTGANGKKPHEDRKSAKK
jgi:hypothetical protein